MNVRARAAHATRARARRPALLFVLVLMGAALGAFAACGGSSSETPYPLEPVPHSAFGGARS